jgi:hypothetical protein
MIDSKWLNASSINSKSDLLYSETCGLGINLKLSYESLSMQSATGLFKLILPVKIGDFELFTLFGFERTASVTILGFKVNFVNF